MEGTEQKKLTEKPKGGLKRTTEDGIYHMNRCASCGRLLTKLEIMDRIDRGHAGEKWTGLCPCGASRFRPSYPRGFEWLAPRVLRMAWAVMRREIAPGVSR